MSLPVVTVVIPTVDGREEHLDRCWRAYADHAAGQYELDLVIVRNEPTCGWGWQKGAERMSAHSGFLHFTCDDIEPQPGWAAPAIEALERHMLPAPRTLNARTRTPEYCPAWGQEVPDLVPAGMSTLPFLTRELWERHVAPLMVGHYYTDNFVSWRAARAGYVPRVRLGYFFLHWWAAPGRMGDARMEHDRLLYERAIAMAEAGEWAAPWPPEEPA